MWGTSSFPPWNSTVLSSFNQKQLHPMSIPSFWGGGRMSHSPPHLRAASPEYLSREMQQHCSELRQKTQTPPPPPPTAPQGSAMLRRGWGGGRTSTASISDKESSTQNSWQTPLLGDGSRGLIPPIPELTFQSY